MTGVVAVGLTGALLAGTAGNGEEASAVEMAVLASAVAQAAGEAPASPGTTSAAAQDVFLFIEGIKGASADAKHPATIDVASWSLGASNPGGFSAGGGAGSGKVSFSDLAVKAPTSIATPPIMISTATGKHAKKAELYVRRGTQADYLVITLEDVLISSFRAGGSSSAPTDSYTLNFAKITISVKPQKADGSLGTAVKASFDRKTNTT